MALGLRPGSPRPGVMPHAAPPHTHTCWLALSKHSALHTGLSAPADPHLPSLSPGWGGEAGAGDSHMGAYLSPCLFRNENP